MTPYQKLLVSCKWKNSDQVGLFSFQHYFCSGWTQDAVYLQLHRYFSIKSNQQNCDADLLTVQVKQQRQVSLWINTVTALKWASLCDFYMFLHGSQDASMCIMIFWKIYLDIKPCLPYLSISHLREPNVCDLFGQERRVLFILAILNLGKILLMCLGSKEINFGRNANRYIESCWYLL